jgi:long-chain acyl-CoA synthetase
MSETERIVSGAEASTIEAGLVRGGVFVSLRELNGRALRAASGLQSLGVGAGDTIALLLRNDIEFFEAAFAAAALGAASVPINWHGSAEEVSYVVADSKARVLVAHADLLHGVIDALPTGVTVFGVSTPASIASEFDVPDALATVPVGVTEWSSWREGFEPLDETHSGDPISMIYTSGTTGHPKGVRRLPGTHDVEGAVGYMGDVVRLFGLWPGVRTIIAGPMYHSAPYAYAMSAARTFGGLLVIQDRFDPEGLLSLIEHYRITSLYMVPTMFVRLLRLSDEVRARYDVSSLRNISHTAAPCPPDVKRALIEWLGPIVTEFYGSTEVGFIAGCDSEEWLAHPGTVGKALASCEIQIMGDEGPLAVGETGEAFVRAKGMPDFTYQGKSEARAEIEREGLITCGDVGFFDEDGFLYLCDRVRDMIISGGVNIYPIEIEACLLKLHGIADCAVFGIPDDEYGESICAAVKLEPDATLSESDIKTHVRAHLAGFKVPKLVAFHDSLPREDSGKMFKRKLRAPYWEQAGRFI